MFDSSVITRSGQAPKALCAFVGFMLGGSLAFLGNFLHPSTSPYGVLFQIGGTAVGLAFFVYGCTSVRCPSCGARWVWDAMRRKSVNAWLPSLLGSRVCPVCGYPDASVTSTPS